MGALSLGVGQYRDARACFRASRRNLPHRHSLSATRILPLAGRPGLSFRGNRQYYPHTITDFARRYPIAFQAPFD